MAIRQQEVIRRLKAGETLLCTLPTGTQRATRPSTTSQGGGRVTTATYRKLTPDMEAVSPGLFAEVEAQEWRWSE